MGWFAWDPADLEVWMQHMSIWNPNPTPKPKDVTPSASPPVSPSTDHPPRVFPSSCSSSVAPVDCPHSGHSHHAMQPPCPALFVLLCFGLPCCWRVWKHVEHVGFCEMWHTSQDSKKEFKQRSLCEQRFKLDYKYHLKISWNQRATTFKFKGTNNLPIARKDSSLGQSIDKSGPK